MSARPPGGGEDLAALVAIVDDLAGAVGAHDRRLRKVERTAVRRSPVAARRRRSHRVGQVVAGGRRPVAPVDPEATAAELADWVDWLRTTYRLAEEVPQIWRTDPAAVAELAALHRAWQAAYAPAAGPTEQLFWQDALARVLDRVGTAATWAPP